MMSILFNVIFRANFQMEYPEHTSSQYDAELRAVCASVLKMGAVVANQFCLALESLATGDLMLVDRVMDDGYAVNAMEVEIDECCTNLLVRRQPTANDLRLVKAIIKTINDLERVGDEAENIARMPRSITPNKSASLPCYRQIKQMAGIAQEILGAALAAFDGLDPDAAKKAGRKEALIDDEFHAVLRHLVAYMMEDTSEISMALQAALVARSVDRIGDHAKNIAEYVIYMVEGREVRNFSTL